MTPFMEAARECIALVHDHHAEPLLLIPMKRAADVNDAWGTDPDRPAVTIRGIFFDAHAKSLIPNAFDPRTDQRPGTNAGKPHMHIPPECADAQIEIRQGDLLERTSSGRRYRAGAPYAMKSGVVDVPLNLIA
jgi:hypothetical protein